MIIQEILHLLDDLDGYGIIFTDEDLVINRLKDLGYKD
jgi:hypothetical protein